MKLNKFAKDALKKYAEADNQVQLAQDYCIDQMNIGKKAAAVACDQIGVLRFDMYLSTYTVK